MKKKQNQEMNSTLISQKASSLRLAAWTIANSMKHGNFKSIFKGRGVEFAGVREYFLGDDIRTIDWNVTARIGRPYVKIFDEDRELVVFLIIDNSMSMGTGMGGKSKYDQACETAALLSFASEQISSPLGAVFFAEDINFAIPPKLGKDHVMRIVKQLEKHGQENLSGSSIETALNGAGQLLKNRSLVVVISDFKIDSYEQSLSILATKHDVLAICITDPSDFALPSIGYIPFFDVESRKKQKLLTSSKEFKRKWMNFSSRNIEKLKKVCSRNGIASLTISTQDDAAFVLSNFFASKERLS